MAAMSTGDEDGAARADAGAPGPAPQPGAHRSGRLALVAAAVVVLGVLVAAVVLAANRTPLRTEPGSPEATVQAYFEAVIDRQRLAALDTFTEELADRCDAALGDQLRFTSLSRVALDHVTVDGTRAEVAVTITETFEGGLLDTGRNQLTESVVLERTADGWRISEPPWPLFGCSVRTGS